MNDGWHPPKDAKIIIVCAANRVKDGTILAGVRHWDNIMYGVAKRLYDSDRSVFGIDTEQGFIDQYGRFYNRKDAYDIVQKSGQPFNQERNGIIGELYSEGLY